MGKNFPIKTLYRSIKPAAMKDKLIQIRVVSSVGHNFAFSLNDAKIRFALFP